MTARTRRETPRSLPGSAAGEAVATILPAAAIADPIPAFVPAAAPAMWAAADDEVREVLGMWIRLSLENQIRLARIMRSNHPLQAKQFRRLEARLMRKLVKRSGGLPS